MTSHEADVIICLMYYLKQCTFSTCADIQAWEHKLTFVWLESCERSVLNTKTHTRKEGGRTGKEVDMVETRGHLQHTVPVLLCCLLLLHLVGGNPPPKWQHTPEGASLVAGARLLPWASRYFRYTGKASVHDVSTGRSRAYMTCMYTH